MAPGLRAFAQGNFPLTSASAAESVQISIAHISIHPQHFTVSHSSFPPAAYIQANNPPLLFVPDETFILFDKCTVHHANVFLEAFVVWKVIANQLLMPVLLVSLDLLLVVCFSHLD